MTFYKDKKMKCKNIGNRQIVVQSNSLINSKYELTDIQQKIILLAISQIDSINDKQFYKYSCTVAELEKLLNIQINHKQFRESCEDLFKKPIRILNKKGWELYGWFQSIKYIDAESRFEFRISDDLIPYLLQLKESFTKFELSQAIQFDGKYTTRFYQFAMQVKNQEKREVKFNLIELYELLQLPKSLKDYRHFRVKVLEPSIKEINKKTDIKAKFEPIKTGRKYTDLILLWSYKKTEQTNKARKKAKIKYTNKQLEKFKGVEFARKGLFKTELYICKNIKIAPEINKERGDGNYCVYVEGGAFFYDSVSDFEKDIKLAKEQKNTTSEKTDKTEIIEKMLSKAIQKI